MLVIQLSKMALFNILDQFVDTKTILLCLVVVLVLATCATILLPYSHRIPADAPPQVSDDLPVVGALGFWTQRWNWWSERRDQSKTGTFSFHVGPNMVVALSGDKGRQVFFESKDLGFGEGCKFPVRTTCEARTDFVHHIQILSYSAKRPNQPKKSPTKTRTLVSMPGSIAASPPS